MAVVVAYKSSFKLDSEQSFQYAQIVFEKNHTSFEKRDFNRNTRHFQQF